MELAHRPSRLSCLDLEATGIDVFNDRIVTVFAGVLDTDSGQWTDSINLLVNPGIDIPAEATAVHGISTRVARSFGIDIQKAMEALDSIFDRHPLLPLVVMNANYDLTLLDEECKRYGSGTWSWESFQIVDPLVLDRHFDKWRKGKRKLANLAENYGVTVDDEMLHDAAGDCFLAGMVAARQIEMYGLPTNEEQAAWYADWAVSYEGWLHSQGKTDIIDTSWPVRKKENA